MTWSRFYTAAGKDGYPPEWHETIKHAVREDAGHRCVRCLHPFQCGESKGDWSPCDDQCTHAGPLRVAAEDAYGKTGSLGLFEDSAAARALVERWPDGGGVYSARVEAAWRVLTVHHLDGNKLNCRWWNLVALCQRCHLQIQGKVQMERVYPWPHSDWFRPYVAGYYAWTYLGQEISREEAADRLDELLGLELAA